jgi:hypothetical protein
MKQILLALTAAAGLTTAAYAIDDQTFFSGIRLGMTLKQVEAYYKTYGHELGLMWHSGALEGEKDYDIRTSSVPQHRIYFSVRADNGKVISVTYWKLGNDETFSPEELRQLTAQNKLTTGKLFTKATTESGAGAQFEVRSEAEQLKRLRTEN